MLPFALKKFMGNIEKRNDTLSIINFADKYHDWHIGGYKLQVLFGEIIVQPLQ